jgi:hypothetical protein
MQLYEHSQSSKFSIGYQFYRHGTAHARMKNDNPQKGEGKVLSSASLLGFADRTKTAGK